MSTNQEIIERFTKRVCDPTPAQTVSRLMSLYRFKLWDRNTKETIEGYIVAKDFDDALGIANSYIAEQLDVYNYDLEGLWEESSPLVLTRVQPE